MRQDATTSFRLLQQRPAWYTKEGACCDSPRQILATKSQPTKRSAYQHGSPPGGVAVRRAVAIAEAVLDATMDDAVLQMMSTRIQSAVGGRKAAVQKMTALEVGDGA